MRLECGTDLLIDQRRPGFQKETHFIRQRLHISCRLVPESRLTAAKGRADGRSRQSDVELDRAELPEQLVRGIEHVGQSRDQERPPVSRQRDDARRRANRTTQPPADARAIVVQPSKVKIRVDAIIGASQQITTESDIQSRDGPGSG